MVIYSWKNYFYFLLLSCNIFFYIVCVKVVIYLFFCFREILFVDINEYYIIIIGVIFEVSVGRKIFCIKECLIISYLSLEFEVNS